MEKKNLMLGSAILLIVLLVAGGTFAWFTATTGDVTNTFTAGTVSIEVEETFDETAAQNVNPGDSYTKEVKIKNTGSKKVFVRLKLVAAFDNPLLDISVVDYPILNGWILHTDGYYYYPFEVAVGGETPNIIETVSFDGPTMGNIYQGEGFTLTVSDIEAIQVTHGAAYDEWLVNPSTL